MKTIHLTLGEAAIIKSALDARLERLEDWKRRSDVDENCGFSEVVYTELRKATIRMRQRMREEFPSPIWR